MRFDPCDLVGIRPDFREISGVGAGEQIARLEEVNVGVDITGQDEFARAIDDACAIWSFRLVASSNGDNALAIDRHAGIRDNLGIAGIDDRSIDQRDLFGARTERNKRRDCKDDKFFHKASLSPAESERTIRSASPSSGA